MKKIICVSMNMGESWRWFAEKITNKEKYYWKFYSNAPKNILERFLKKFNIAKHRASFKAGLNFRFTKECVLVSHLPDYTAWSAFFSGKSSKRNFQLAYSFNFTKLPTGLKKLFMTRQFRKVDKFTVYSNFEKELYSKYFNIPVEKIDMLHLGLGIPEVNEEAIIQGEYICAIGGEGRDYKTLIQVAEKLSDTNFIVVARPHNLKGVKIPSNVKLHYNIPIEKVFNIIKYSNFSIVPLLHSKVPCGHITMVFTMHLGKAQIVSMSEGVKDYVKDDYNALLFKAGDSEDLLKKIKELSENKEKTNLLEFNAKEFSSEFCSEEKNVEYFEQLLIDSKKIKKNSNKNIIRRQI